MLMKHLSKDNILGRVILTPRCPGQSRLQQLVLNPGHLGLEKFYQLRHWPLTSQESGTDLAKVAVAKMVRKRTVLIMVEREGLWG